MASMGFSYAQIHVSQEKIRRRISEKAAAATTTMNKSTTKEEEASKTNESFRAEAVRDSRTAGRVHPCASSTAAAAGPMGGHR
ncbi:unnamed protein product [Alopecurus aequalis]